MRQGNRYVRAAMPAVCVIGVFSGPPALARPEVGPEAFSANATRLDFDDLVGGATLFQGDILTTQYASQGVLFINPWYVSRANTGLAVGAVGNSDPNLIWVDQDGGITPNVPPQEVAFSVPVQRVGFWFGTGDDGTIHLQAFGESGFLEEVTRVGALTGPNRREGFIGIERPERIAMIRIFSRRTNIAFPIGNPLFDDLRFEWGCYPDCVGNGVLNLSDFGCFQTRFVLGDQYTDCNADGLLSVADFGCFQGRWVLGCP